MSLRHFFPYHTIFSLIIGLHLGRHLGYIEMLNDARVASSGFFKDNVCTTRINKEKQFKKVPGPLKIRPNSAGPFLVILVFDTFFRHFFAVEGRTRYKIGKSILRMMFLLHTCTFNT